MFDIIVLNYRAIDKLRRCLESVRRRTRGDYLITVVDNEGSGESIAALAAIPGIQVLSPGKNLGCAGGTNLALSRTSGEFIVLLDDDAQVTRGWLRGLHRQLLRHPGAAIVGSKVVYPDGRVMCAEYLPRSLRAVGYGEKDLGQRDYTRECSSVVRTCAMLRRSAVREIGLFDERFFPGQYEMMDYCLRARQAGYRVLYTGSVKVLHDHLFRGEKDFPEMEKRYLEKWAGLFDGILEGGHPADRHLSSAFLLFQKEDFAEAAKEFLRAESLDRRFSQPFPLGVCLYRTGRYREALKALRRAERLAPGDAVVHHYLALTHEKLGSPRGMRREAERVLDYLEDHRNKTSKGPLREGVTHRWIEIDGSRHQIRYCG